MSNIISYPGIQELEANDLMLITDVSKDDKPLRSISIGRLATYIEGGGGTSTSINGETGSITFVAGNNVSIDKVGKTFTINSAGGGGGGGGVFTPNATEPTGTESPTNNATGQYSFSTGNSNNASGNYAFSAGFISNASGLGGVAIGFNTKAIGGYSLATNINTEAIGDWTTAMGVSTRAATDASTALGIYNLSNQTSDNTAFVIGNGEDGNNRSDAFRVDFDGNATADSFIKTGGLSTEYLMADGSVTTGGGGGGGGTITIDSSAGTIFAANAMTIAAKDPNADKIVYWNDLATRLDYLSIGSGLSLSGGTLIATGGGGGSTQNLFETIAVSGQSSIVADSPTDTLTLAAGTGIELTTNALTDTVTIAATGGGSGHVDTNEIAFFVEWPSSNTAVTNFNPMADWDISGMQWQWNYDGATGRYLLECKSEDWFDWGYRITMSANLNAFSNGKLIQVEMMRISKTTILVEAFQIDGTGVQRHDLIDTDMRGADIEPELGAYAQGLDIRIKRFPIGA